MQTKLFTKTNNWFSLVLILAAACSVFAQTTEFTYQGKLNDNGVPASAAYDMQFKLFDGLTAGSQVSTTQTKTSVPTSGGVFSVSLDFSSGSFDGTERWLEIAVSPAGQNNFVTLAPRQKLNSVPYAVQSLNAATADNALQLGGIAADQFVQTNDVRLSDARIPLAGSGNYIQNSKTAQSSANFSVGGTGSANILNAATQFNLNGSRILSNPGFGNLFAGLLAGAGNTTGSGNSFYGNRAGEANTTGLGNSIFGNYAGNLNTTGGNNSFFGDFAGTNNTSGNRNSFFGGSAGNRNTTGSDNSFIGVNVGSANTTGINNSFFGSQAGTNNTSGNDNTAAGRQSGLFNTTGSKNSFFGVSSGTNNSIGEENVFVGFFAGGNSTAGNNNSFFGSRSGVGNTIGSNNTAVGYNANFTSNNLTYATAIGAGAQVSASNTVVLGRSADTVQIPGALTIAGSFGANILNAATQFNLNSVRILSNAGTDNLFAGLNAGASNAGGSENSFFGSRTGQGNSTGIRNSFFGNGAGIGNTTGSNNSSFGNGAGGGNTGSGNSFFGSGAGNYNQSGNNNTFVGYNANTNQVFSDGDGNTLVGANTVTPNGANNNTIIGVAASSSGSNNTIFGANSSVTGSGTNNSIAIGNSVTVSTTNTIVVGTAAQTTVFPGRVVLDAVGTINPNGTNGVAATFGGGFSGLIAQNLIFRRLGSDILGSPVHLCIRSTSVGGGDGGWGLTSCTTNFASRENKTDEQPFAGGFDIIKQLNPIQFKWKADGAADVGLNAEDVAEIAPQLVTRDEQGKIEDVRENTLDVLFINAFKEQQKQIEAQQRQIDALKKLLCALNAQAEICRQ